MALLIRGKTACAICERIIGSDDAAMMFPAFATNELDELWMFNDASVHEKCIQVHPLRSQLFLRVNEMKEATAPSHRICRVCGKVTINPDDYFTTGHFSDSIEDDAYEFNYLHLHRSCIAEWSDTDKFCRVLSNLDKSSLWRGPTLSALVNEVRASCTKSVPHEN